jgi:protein involved in polysaccharide export with SLBB domain
MRHCTSPLRGLVSKLFLGTALLASAACSSPGGPPLGEIAPEINATFVEGQFVLTPGDVMTVTFPRAPEWTQEEVVVLADGTASFAGIDPVRVAGLTIGQLSSNLRERYAQIPSISDASVSVQVITPATRTVSILGEVLEPGAIEVGPEGRLTLIEAITRAGSFDKNTAWLSNTMLIRWVPEDQAQRWWKIDARPKHWDSRNPILLQQYDIVYVPNTVIDRVDIWVDNFIRRILPFPFIPTV